MSDPTATNATPDPALLQYGGQAVIEGVMMRSPHYFAVACRTPDGQIVIQREEVNKGILGKLKGLNKPFLRGTLALVDAMALGSRALSFASKLQLDAIVENGDSDVAPAASVTPLERLAVGAANGMPEVAAPKQGGRISDIVITTTLITSLITAAIIFRAIPTLLTQWAGSLGWISKGTDRKSVV